MAYGFLSCARTAIVVAALSACTVTSADDGSSGTASGSRGPGGSGAATGGDDVDPAICDAENWEDDGPGEAVVFEIVNRSGGQIVTTAGFDFCSEPPRITPSTGGDPLPTLGSYRGVRCRQALEEGVCGWYGAGCGLMTIAIDPDAVHPVPWSGTLISETELPTGCIVGCEEPTPCDLHNPVAPGVYRAEFTIFGGCEGVDGTPSACECGFENGDGTCFAAGSPAFEDQSTVVVEFRYPATAPIRVEVGCAGAACESGP